MTPLYVRLAAVVSRRLAMVRERRLKVTDSVSLGAAARLAVVTFGSRELLLAVSRNGIVLLTEREL